MTFKSPPLIMTAIGTLKTDLAAQATVLEDAQKAAAAAELLLKQATARHNELEGGIAKLNRLAIIERGLPQAVRVLREEITAHDRDADDLDRTERQQRQSERLANEARAQLIELCPHTFLYHIRRYEGTRSDDYDDAHPGSLTCLVCGLREEEHEKRRGNDESYEMLAKGEHLYVRSLESGMKYESLPKPIPWETIRSLFLENDLRRAAAAIGYKLK